MKKKAIKKKYTTVKRKKIAVKKIAVKKIKSKKMVKVLISAQSGSPPKDGQAASGEKKINLKNKLRKNQTKKVIVKSKLKKTQAKKVIVKNKPKKIEPKTDLLTNSFFKAKIKVIGIGGGGGSIVSEIGRSLDKAKFVIADTDTRVFKKRRGIKYLLLGQKLTHGLGTGLDPNLGRMAAEQEKEKITKLFDDQDMAIFVASLGGGVGSGATPVFAELSKNFKGVSFGIFTLPFKFEGKNKYKIATKSLQELRKHLNVSITIENEKIFKIINPDTSITEAFSIVNKSLIESLESLIDLIYNPGVINIDFADLRTILGGKGNLAFLNTAEASGKDKLEKISQEILHNPLYQSPVELNNALNVGRSNNFTAEKILFNIAGGKNLSMLEVDKISRIIAEQNPKAKIIFGISKNLKYKDKIKVTILITGSPIVKEIVELKVPIVKPLRIISKVVEKIKNLKIKSKKKNKSSLIAVSKDKEKILLIDTLAPVFNNVPVNFENSIKFSVFETTNEPKRAIRRSALEIKNDQEIEENKKSQQEKEWEIPAFLRLKK